VEIFTDELAALKQTSPIDVKSRLPSNLLKAPRATRVISEFEMAYLILVGTCKFLAPIFSSTILQDQAQGKAIS